MRRIISESSVKEAVVETGFAEDESSKWYEKFRNLRKSSSRRGLQTLLGFDEYLGLAKEAGLTKADQIGTLSHQHVLGRIGDVGNYEVGNCRFITATRNREELHENGGLQSHYEKMRGSTKENNDAVRRMAATLTGRTKETHPGPASVSKRRAKEFTIFDPEGNMYFGKNLFEFCNTHGLSQPSMSHVCHGTQESHKGWSGYHEAPLTAYFHEEEK